MHGETLVAVYATRTQAEKAREHLRDFGVPEAEIRLSADGTGIDDSSTVASATGDGNPLAPQRSEGFLDWLFGSDAPESDRTWYGDNLREGRTAVCVRVADAGLDRERVADILEEMDPLDMEGDGDRASTPVPQTGLAGSPVGTSRGYARAEDVSAEASRRAADEDEVIPVVKEELHIGKRVVERRQRIRVYVVERPVEEQVRLRDEIVEIERRPASGDRAPGPDAFRERTFEVVERDEEPVVEKTARAAEEVVVHKEAAERTETVRDKLRETRVEVDRAAAGSKPGTAADRTGPSSDDRDLRDSIAGTAPDPKEDAKDAFKK